MSLFVRSFLLFHTILHISSFLLGQLTNLLTVPFKFLILPFLFLPRSGMVGLSENNASATIPKGDWATVTVHFNDTLKSCVQPRPEDEMLKMVFQKSTGRILGVHIFGAGAAEMIHHASSLVNNPIENTIWHVVKSVPPAVTYAEVLMKACQRAVDVIHGN